MPELQDESLTGDAFYSDYVATYLERDVRDLTSIKDEIKFYHFLVATQREPDGSSAALKIWLITRSGSGMSSVRQRSPTL